MTAHVLVCPVGASFEVYGPWNSNKGIDNAVEACERAHVRAVPVELRGHDQFRALVDDGTEGAS